MQGERRGAYSGHKSVLTGFWIMYERLITWGDRGQTLLGTEEPYGCASGPCLCMKLALGGSVLLRRKKLILTLVLC